MTDDTKQPSAADLDAQAEEQSIATMTDAHEVESASHKAVEELESVNRAPYGMIDVFCAGCGKALPSKPAAQPGQFKTTGCCKECFPGSEGAV
jgi:hypothetical protein